jgi:hypothetical protein
MHLFNLPTYEQPFTHFELGLTENEHSILDSLCIKKHMQFALAITKKELQNTLDNPHSEKETNIFEKIKNFVMLLGEGENESNTCSLLVGLLLRISIKTLDSFKQESAYIIFRSFIPNEEYKIPRWHQDGYYFAPYSEEYEKSPIVKAAIALKGAGTLFYKLSPVELEEFRKMRAAGQDRIQLSKLLNDVSKVESTPKGSGSAFIVGPQGAMHSEPYMTTTRFYMSLLPGTEKQIQEYEGKEKMVAEMHQSGKTSNEINEAVIKYIEDRMKNFKENLKKGN